MTTYVEPSAMLKHYLDEPEGPRALELMQLDPVLATSWLTVVEVRRNLVHNLRGANRAARREEFEAHADGMALIPVNQATWLLAAEIAETHGVRSLDAVHLACAKVLDIRSLDFLTFDRRQAKAAVALGFNVLGVDG